MAPLWLALTLACSGCLVGVEAASTAGPAVDDAPRGPEQATEVVDCQTRSQLVPGRRPHTATSLRRDAVPIGDAFVFARHYADTRRSELETRGRRQKLAKAPFVVAAGGPTRVALTRRSASRAELDIALDAGPPALRADTISFRPCPPDAEVAERRVGRFTVFIGGVRLDDAQCLRLVVATEGDAPERARVPFGRETCR